MKTSIMLGDKQIEYTLLRRKRKTVGISMSFEKGIQVLAPSWIDASEIQNILMKKSSWILKKLPHIEKTKVESPKRNFTAGESLTYLGADYKLDIWEKSDLSNIRISLHEHRILVSIPVLPHERRSAFVRTALVEWYKTRSAELISERVRFYAGKLGVNPQKIVIKEQKSIWGSCSSKSNLNFNWKIVMAPPSIVDYLVVHELSHLKEMNHSKQFWALVGSILPDYKERSKWLKEHGRTLNLD